MDDGIEEQVSRHHGGEGLEQAIVTALRAAGMDVDRLLPADLAGVDEFHLGWKQATVALAADLALEPGLNVLDIGSGLGGPARHFAEAHRCRVEGIDLSQDYVDCATELTRRCGLADRVRIRRADALALPFGDGSFDRATLIHVGMSVADKRAMFAEAHRVLAPGGLLGIYDVMRVGPAPLVYPMPWAATEVASFVAAPEDYRAALAAAGFAVEREESRRDLVRALWRQMREEAARQGPPPLSLRIVMGPTASQRIANVMAALDAGTIAPVEIIARAARRTSGGEDPIRR